MTTSQPTRQILMGLFWQSNRAPADRSGPLAWTPSLDGPRLTGGHLHIPGHASTGNAPWPARWADRSVRAPPVTAGNGANREILTQNEDRDKRP